ncbi:CRISPR-associated protein Cas4 [Natronomonas sp. EA1]|uniref:CRISPR-associated protein Cas4 n=1 Tax=Natronomonas sp. EA1 TaxID=3421655 RepID=UPI003EB6AAFD
MTDSKLDPVELLLSGARDSTTEPEFRVTGVMMQYYEACTRELWFLSRNIEIDRGNASIVRGTNVDESAYGDKRRNLTIDGTISLDLLDSGEVVEVKPSSSMVEPATLQLLYYLWYLEEVVGVERDGVLAHPTERRREAVELTPENRARVEDAIRGIYEITQRETPPKVERKSYCSSCAYHDFCWSC